MQKKQVQHDLCPYRKLSIWIGNIMLGVEKVRCATKMQVMF